MKRRRERGREGEREGEGEGEGEGGVFRHGYDIMVVVAASVIDLGRFGVAAVLHFETLRRTFQSHNNMVSSSSFLITHTIFTPRASRVMDRLCVIEPPNAALELLFGTIS